ncbi:MAG: discoidin domain-containing protein [Lentisphaeria bacterium]|nr:discoidin domain-containing protein [Lentisphaeria bacterium]
MAWRTRRGMQPLLAALTLSTAGALSKAQDTPRPEEIERITAAMPERPTVPPRTPRRILVMNACHGFYHSSIPYGAKAFEIMGRKTGAFATVETGDLRSFAPETLAGFDAVIINNATLRLPLVARDLDKRTEAERQALEAEEQRLQQSLLDFVRNGKGLIGVHAATDALYTWPEYGEMLGGYFSGHPWNEDVTVKIDDPAHPIVKAFRGMNFVVADEIYQFREPYSRDVLRVLLSLDTARTNMAKESVQRKDGDFAVAWIRQYGQGRVFFFSLGHRHEIFWNRPILQCYLDGIQYALGDLEADATPSAALTPEYLAASRRKGLDAGIEAMFAGFAAYQPGVDDTDAKRLDELVIQAQDPAQTEIRQVLATRLGGLLRDPRATAAARGLACKHLSRIGDETAVPAVATQLTDADVAPLALYALQRLPGQAAEAALVAALPPAAGRTRVGIVNALGVRRVGTAVPALAALLPTEDADAARAAAAALGRIATPEAITALLSTPPRAPVAVSVEAALIEATDMLLGSPAVGDDARRLAETALRRVLDGTASESLRAAAFRALTLLRGAEALPDLVNALRAQRSEMTFAAAACVAEMAAEETVPAVGIAFPEMPADVRCLVLDSLARRADAQGLGIALGAAKDADAKVRAAAVRALETLGNADCVTMLAETAAATEEDASVRAAARAALAHLAAPDVDAVIERNLEGRPPAVQTELVRALGQRKVFGAVPVLIRSAGAEDRDLAREAVAALDLVAREGDLPALVTLLCGTADSSARGKLETMVVGVARRAADAQAGPRAVLGALAGPVGTEARCSLLEVLGRMAHPDALPALYEALEAPEEEVRKAAVKALADWPDATPMERLRQVSLSSAVETHRVLALRGYARQLAMPSRRPMRETLQLYREALDQTRGEPETRSLITGLGNVVHPDALALVKHYVGQQAYEAEALMAAIAILKGLEGAAMKVTASSSGGGDKPERAIDHTRATRWTSGRKQAGDEWFQIDLGYETEIGEIMLDAGDTGHDYPREYRISVSTDGETWGSPVLEGKGDAKIMTLQLANAYGRYIRIEQLGTSPGNFWSIADLKINGRPEHVDEEKLKLDRAGWTVSASAGDDTATHAIDGDLEQRWGTGRGQKPGDWFQVDLGATRTVRRIILDAAKSGSDYPRGYKVMISDDGETWRGPIAMGTPEKKARTVITVLPTAGRFLRIIQTGDGEHWWWSIYDLQVLAE